MSELNWSAYSHWQEPPDLHEICKCFMCHEAGEHELDVEYWAPVCAACEEERIRGLQTANIDA